MSKLIHTDFGRNVKLLKKCLNRRIKFPTEGLHTHCVFMGMLHDHSRPTVCLWVCYMTTQDTLVDIVNTRYGVIVGIVT